MQKIVVIALGLTITFGALLLVSTSYAAGGFDDFGYNYNARIFVGPADGVDKILDGKVWGDSFYANDLLKMTWSKAWDAARFDDAPWTCDAWEDNQWNGMMPDGSQETWHYKIVWVGPDLENSDCWHEGGYPIWNEFEVIFSHGTFDGEHIWDVNAFPAGYGIN